ncbi:MAG: hypothetical protein IJS20_07180 [Bacteroidales bacterium]|nr:hypothetical protein [Bacteroidales bacterium]
MSKHIYFDIMIWLSGMAVTMVSAQTAEQNYVETVTYLNRGGSDSIISVQYFDGLGQQVQTVTGGNSGGKYLHTVTEYDGLGRESKVWAPVVGDNTPDFMPEEDIVSQSLATYDDPAAFSRVQYDGLDRKTFTSTPGEAWQSRGKGKRAAYRFNKTGEVKHYTMDDLRGSQRYEAGLLSCTVTSDEDSLEVLTFKDFLGNVILERKGAEGEYIETYYVYNDLGQLAYVLPPMYNANPTTENLDLYAFCYTYDDHGRVKTKKLPGCDSIKYWYDKADRVIKMQDGLLISMGGTDLFRVYEYDGLDRMTRQSIAHGGNIENDEIINFYDNYQFLDSTEYKALIPAGLTTQPFTSISEKYSRGQQTGVWQLASNGESMLTIFGYDDHGRVTKKLEIGLGHNATMTETAYNFVGDVTAENVTYYAYNEASGSVSPTFYASTTNKYDIPHTKLLGSTLYSILDITTGRYPVSGDTLQSFKYDDFGRVISNSRKGTGGDMTYEYDNLHGWLTRMRAGSGFEQKLYRESGALNNRFNGSISAMTWRMTDSGKTRRYDYTYDELNRLTEAVYSEKKAVSAQRSFPKPSFDDVLRGKAPVTLIPTALNDYDCNNHYTELVEYDANSNITGLQRYGMLNDKSYGLIDDLTVEYNGNQRVSVEDESDTKLTYSGAFDFVDGVSGSKEYSYNENGALTKDSNKGITSISYDLLGNPLKVTMQDGNNIEYVYAADGTRLKATHNTKLSAGRYSSRDRYYRGNLIFVRSNDKLPYTVLVPGGYYFYESADEAFYLSLYVQDYQGNNRAELYEGNSVFDQTHYYPFGGVIGDLSSPSSFNAGNEFKFSGKELDRQFGLDLYDFHARQYDATAPWFYGVDKKSEDYYWLSPYNYCAGNPVNYIDPDGNAIVFVNGFRPSAGARDMCTSPLGSSKYNSIYHEDKFEYWDRRIVNYYQDQYNDKNISFTSGSSFMDSNVAMREKEGVAKAMIFHNMVADGEITLNGDEPIRFISHSQGAATAAAMASKLKELGYNVVVIEYITPHQAKDINHPEGVQGIQFDQTHDCVVSGKGRIKGVEARFEDWSHQTSLLGGHSNSDNVDVIKRAERLRKTK